MASAGLRVGVLAHRKTGFETAERIKAQKCLETVTRRRIRPIFQYFKRSTVLLAVNSRRSHLGSLERILKLGLVFDSFSLFTGLSFSCRQIQSHPLLTTGT